MIWLQKFLKFDATAKGKQILAVVSGNRHQHLFFFLSFLQGKIGNLLNYT
jgi:hypothetical protein